MEKSRNGGGNISFWVLYEDKNQKCLFQDFFRIYLSEYELALLETMMSDGEFIVYAGRVVNSVVEYVLHSYKKMKDIEFWPDY